MNAFDRPLAQRLASTEWYYLYDKQWCSCLYQFINEFKPVIGEDVKIIVRSQSPNDVTNGNLGGCKDWNCAIRNRDSLSEQVAEAFLLDTSDKPGKRNPSQYYVLFTQVTLIF